MRSPLASAAYTLGQSARVGLYWGQYWLSARVTRPKKAPRPIAGPFPKTPEILADLRRLLARDLADIQAGRYRLPHDLVETPIRALRQARAYFRDLQQVERRRHAGAAFELRESAAASDAGAEGLPPYYLQNFHYQTDGYLSEASAALYDHQVEVLFGGGADAMRRRALPPLAELVAERGVKNTRLIDIGCGTGRFLTFAKDNYPRLSVTGLDLSPAYLEAAREALAPWRGVSLLTATAEETGLASQSFEIATCTFLFHELPRKVRGQVAREIHRLLVPGGRLVFIETVQKGDHPPYDALLDYFPVAFHEPYYADYVRQDLEALFSEAGFALEREERAYFAKVMVLRKV